MDSPGAAIIGPPASSARQAAMASEEPTTTSDNTQPNETPEAARSALQTTLNVASTAAHLVMFPYVVAGRAAYQATSFAVTAPIKVTKHVANSLTESWQQQTPAEAPPSVDLFGERELELSSVAAVSASAEVKREHCENDEENMPVVEGVLFEAEAPVKPEPSRSSAAEIKPVDTIVPRTGTQGVVSQLIFLPVRFVSSSVSSAAALPASAIAFGGRTISGAVSSSQSLASSALVASSGLALRTTRHVASGLTHGAFSTAHRVTGLVGSSVRTASYVIPPSISNALWQGMERTGSISTSVIAYAIAVPTYRMTQALVPEINELFTEQQLVDSTKDGVTVLTKVLGPQNAFYVLKFMYETVNSEEVYDGFLLCQDIVRESLDAENYKNAGSSLSKATGLETLAPVVTSLYEMMPSLDELFDGALLVGDIVDEIMTQVAAMPTRDDAMVVDTGRFEYLSSEEEDAASITEESYESESGESTSSFTASETLLTAPVVFAHESFEGHGEVVEAANEPEQEDAAAPIMDADAFSGSICSEDELTDKEEEDAGILPGTIDADVFALTSDEVTSEPSSTTTDEDPLAELFNSGVSFFSSVLDSNEASMLLNTFGDFIDVLVE